MKTGKIHDIFINYNSNNLENAKKIAKYLDDNGFKIWFDYWDLPIGEEIENKLSEAIGKSEVILILIDKYSINSKFTIEKIKNLIKFNKVLLAFEKDIAVSDFPIKITDKINTFSIDYNDLSLLLNKLCEISEKLNVNCLSNFALKEYYLGNYDNALDLFNKILEINKKILGENHPDTANTYNNLASIYQAVGDYEKALPLYEKALKINIKVLGENHPDTATGYNNLASIYQAMGDYYKALKYYTKALEIQHKVLGENHPDTATGYNNLASIYQAVGDYEKALPLYEKALKINIKVLGENHPDIAKTYNNLASVYQAMGDYEKLLDYYQRALMVETHRNSITVIGIGGGVNNVINYLAKKHIKSIDMIVVDTDVQNFDNSLASHKIQIGKSFAKGRGCAMVPDKGRKAALENYNEIKMSLQGSNLVFITAGLGGGTGTGAAPIVAKVAKEVGALTVAVVTTPFKFEGRKRMQLAETGLEELKKVCDSLLVIPNEKLLATIDKKLDLKKSFKFVDNILYQSITSISNIIISHSPDDISLDFADLKTVMSCKGKASIGVGKASGRKAIHNATIQALNSPLFEDISINKAQGILVHFNIHPEFSLMQIEESIDYIEKYIEEDAYVIFGTTTDLLIAKDEVLITVIATGLEKK